MMRITIQETPNITAEVIQIVTQFVNGISIDAITKSIWDKYHLEFNTTQASVFQQQSKLVCTAANRIFKYLTATADMQSDRLRFFFQTYPADPAGEAINLAQSMILTFLNMEVRDFHAQIQFVSETFHNKGLSYILQELCSGGMGIEDQESYLSKPLVQQIQELPYPAEFKWNLNLVLSDFDYYLSELAELLLPFVQYVNSELEVFSSALDLFKEQWGAYFAEKDAEQFAKQFLNVDQSYDKNKQIFVVPWIFGGNIVGMEKAQDGSVYFHIGILIQPFFRASNGPKDTELICRQLRALGDVSKFEILQYISDKKAYGIELAKTLNLTTATVSKHMSILRSCGLIDAEKQNDNRVYFSVNRPAVIQLLDDIRSCLIK